MIGVLDPEVCLMDCRMILDMGSLEGIFLLFFLLWVCMLVCG